MYKNLATAISVLGIAGFAFANTGTSTTNSSKVYRTTQSTSTATTAEDQGKTESDTQTTRSIRQRIQDDDTISTMGKNVTIISKDGMVTLKGAVPSTAERNKLNKIAIDVSGQPVSDQMTISR